MDPRHFSGAIFVSYGVMTLEHPKRHIGLRCFFELRPLGVYQNGYFGLVGVKAHFEKKKKPGKNTFQTKIY